MRVVGLKQRWKPSSLPTSTSPDHLFLVFKQHIVEHFSDCFWSSIEALREQYGVKAIVGTQLPRNGASIGVALGAPASAGIGWRNAPALHCLQQLGDFAIGATEVVPIVVVTRR
ncbi:MAG: hypothetical protein AAFX44_19440 [Pseudomonadota bacterium]